MTKNFFLDPNIEKIIDKLSKDKQKEVYQKLENNYLFEKYCLENDKENLERLLENNFSFSSYIEDMNLNDIDDDDLSTEISKNHFFILSNNFVITEELTGVLLNYLFHLKEMNLFRKKYFMIEKDIDRFEYQYKLFNNSLNYLHDEKNYIINGILNNKNSMIYNKFLEIEKQHDINFFINNRDNINIENYKNYFYFVREQVEKNKLFYIYYTIFVRPCQEEIKEFLLKECTEDFKLPSIFHTQILFYTDYIERNYTMSARSNKVPRLRIPKHVACEKLVLSINKASTLQSLGELFNFLEVNEVPSQYYQHLMLKHDLEKNLDLPIASKNNIVNKI